MTDDGDEANQGSGDSPSALTRSELDMWEAARNVEAAGQLSQMLEPDQSELTEDTVRMYLREIGRIPLLTREEEQVLGRRIRSGDEQAVHELVQANLRFVVNISKRYMNRGIPLSDLVTEGNLGLYEAARRFDERKGCAFISYAVWWIRRNLNKALADQLHLVHYPHSRRDTLRSVCRAEESLEKKRGYVEQHEAQTLVMGRDWEGRFDFLADVCEVVYLPRTPAISTTALIEKIRT